MSDIAMCSPLLRDRVVRGWRKSLLFDTLLAQQFVLLRLDLGVDLGAFGGLVAVVARLDGCDRLASWL